MLNRGRTHALVAAVALVAFLAFPAEIAAHGALKRSEPARNAKLASVPTQIRLTFNEVPVVAFTKIALTGPTGLVRLGDLRVDSLRTVVAEIESPLSAGSYTVAWQFAGKDGHPVRGTYIFTVLADAAGLSATSATPDSTHGEAAAGIPAPGRDSVQTEHPLPPSNAFDASSTSFWLIRWLTYLALLGVIGAVAFRFAVLPRYGRLAAVDAADARASFADSAAARAASLGVLAALLLAVAAILRLGAQARAVHGGLGALSASVIGGMITHTVWGWGWMLQFVLAGLAAVMFVRARKSGLGATGWKALLPIAIALAFTPALAGHAIASTRLTAIAVVADALHIIGASGWLGSLAVMLFAGIPAALAVAGDRRERFVADLVNAFSPTALAFAALVVLSGVFAAWLHLGRWSALTQTEYGQALLWKLGVLVILVITGAFNWLRVRPALGGEGGSVRIRRSARVEIVVAAWVLLITSALVAKPTPVERDEPAVTTTH